MKPRYTWCDLPHHHFVRRPTASEYKRYKKDLPIRPPSARCPICNKMITCSLYDMDDYGGLYDLSWTISPHKRRMKASEIKAQKDGRSL